MKSLIRILIAVIMAANYTQCNTVPPEKVKMPKCDFDGMYVEHFNESTAEFFNLIAGENGEMGNRYSQGIDSPSEKETKIMMLRIDPENQVGTGCCAQITSKYVSHFGTYAVRLKLPDVVKMQPNVGAVVGCFTYQLETVNERSEIDIEWLIADPRYIHIGTWTGTKTEDKAQGISRVINLATGEIRSTTCRIGIHSNVRHPLTKDQNQPEKIQPIKNYNAASQFYIYGFDWLPERVIWWIIDPTSCEKMVLWDYKRPTHVTACDFTGIPQHQTHYVLNFWHTNNWTVETNRHSIEKPRDYYGVEIDWISYTPLNATTVD